MSKQYKLIENVFVLPKLIGHRDEIKTESFNLRLYMDSKDGLEVTYQPAKIYVTKKDKNGYVKIIIEYKGIYWLDCEQSMERLENEITPDKLSQYIKLLVCYDSGPITKKILNQTDLMI